VSEVIGVGFLVIAVLVWNTGWILYRLADIEEKLDRLLAVFKEGKRKGHD
jgi:hypothetical protein